MFHLKRDTDRVKEKEEKAERHDEYREEERNGVICAKTPVAHLTAVLTLRLVSGRAHT